MPRLHLAASTSILESRGYESAQFNIRPFDRRDQSTVSDLLVEAYRGTPDSEPDDDTETDRTIAGDYGPLIESATVVARSSHTGEIIGACLTCFNEGRALLAHIVVDPRFQGQGVAGCMIGAALKGLLEEGHLKAELAVSADNPKALRTYARLGFVLYSEDAIFDAGGARYETKKCFDDVFANIIAACPELRLTRYSGVGVLSPRVGREYRLVNDNSDHTLPPVLLALVTGYRSGESEFEITGSILDAAIALLRPAGFADLYTHPNLTWWSGLRSLPVGPTLTVRFSDNRFSQ